MIEEIISEVEDTSKNPQKLRRLKKKQTEYSKTVWQLQRASYAGNGKTRGDEKGKGTEKIFEAINVWELPPPQLMSDTVSSETSKRLNAKTPTHRDIIFKRQDIKIFITKWKMQATYCVIPNIRHSTIGKTTGFPGGSDGKASGLQCGRPEFNPWVGKILWRRQWHPTPVLWPGKSHGQRSLVDYSPRGRKELDTSLSDFTSQIW